MNRIASFGLLALFACQGEVASEALTLDADTMSRQSCGGFLGAECPAGQICVDDPSDGCDPALGGADCIGMCVGGGNANGNGNGNGNGNNGVGNCGNPSTKTYLATDQNLCLSIRFICDEGTAPFFNDCGCGCEEVGEACGTDYCDVGDVCCNDSCGICTPPGGFCTQQICE